MGGTEVLTWHQGDEEGSPLGPPDEPSCLPSAWPCAAQEHRVSAVLALREVAMLCSRRLAHA